MSFDHKPVDEESSLPDHPPGWESLLFDFAEGLELDGEKLRLIRQHLTECEPCLLQLAAQKSARESLRGIPLVPPPQELEDEVFTRMGQQLSTQPSVESEKKVRALSRGLFRGKGTGRVLRQAWLPAAATLLMVTVALAAVGTFGRGDNSVLPPPSEAEGQYSRVEAPPTSLQGETGGRSPELGDSASSTVSTAAGETLSATGATQAGRTSATSGTSSTSAPSATSTTEATSAATAATSSTTTTTLSKAGDGCDIPASSTLLYAITPLSAGRAPSPDELLGARPLPADLWLGGPSFAVVVPAGSASDALAVLEQGGFRPRTLKPTTQAELQALNRITADVSSYPWFCPPNQATGGQGDTAPAPRSGVAEGDRQLLVIVIRP